MNTQCPTPLRRPQLRVVGTHDGNTFCGVWNIGSDTTDIGWIHSDRLEWSGAKNILHLVYPTPRGMLPSVRSLIDYLLIHVPAWLQERSI
jgi:hypothetical protein